MAVAFASAGTAAAGSTSCSIGYPASPAAGDLLLFVLTSKYPGVATPSTPAGLTLLSRQQSTLGGAAGEDSGNVYLSIYYRISDGTETGSVAFTHTSGNVVRGQAFRYTSTRNQWQLSTVSQEGSGQLWSVTTSDPGLDSSKDDLVLVCNAFNTNAFSNTETLTVPGMTFGSFTERHDAVSNQGDDCSTLVVEFPITSGISSGSATFTSNVAADGAIVPYGVTTILRIRDQSGVGASTGAATAAAVGSATATVVGSAQGTATASAVGVAAHYAVGAGTCTASVAATGRSTAVSDGETVAGVATAAATGSATTRAVGSAAGTSTAECVNVFGDCEGTGELTGEFVGIHPIDGEVCLGTGELTGEFVKTKIISGNCVAVGLLVSEPKSGPFGTFAVRSMRADAPLTATGNIEMGGTLPSTFVLRGDITGVGLATCSPTSEQLASSAMLGVGDLTGNPGRSQNMSGEALGEGLLENSEVLKSLTLSGDATGVGLLELGANSASFVLTGAMLGEGLLTGAPLATLVFEPASALGEGLFSGVVQASRPASGEGTGVGLLTGSGSRSRDVGTGDLTGVLDALMINVIGGEATGIGLLETTEWVAAHVLTGSLAGTGLLSGTFIASKPFVNDDFVGAGVLSEAVINSVGDSEGGDFVGVGVLSTDPTDWDVVRPLAGSSIATGTLSGTFDKTVGIAGAALATGNLTHKIPRMATASGSRTSTEISYRGTSTLRNR